MRKAREVSGWIITLGVVLLGARSIEAQQFWGNATLLGQVRQNALSSGTDSPTDLYGLTGVDNLHRGISANTYFRLERDFGTGQTTTDYYLGSFRVPYKGIEFTGGRQFLAETGGGVYTADAGKLRFDWGGPVALTVFGGQPHYVEPNYYPAQYSQDEQIFGGSLRTTKLRDASLNLGFMQYQRDGRTLQQLLSATGTYALRGLPGSPNLYGMATYDADYQNIDQLTAGVHSFLGTPRLQVNFESGYYKPQDNGRRLITDVNLREDPIFQLYSLSQMLQFRGGLRYAIQRGLSAYANCSYQRYDQLGGMYQNGYVARTGLIWLPGGDGLEVVRVEYYLLDGAGDSVNGGRISYDSRVYERLLFRSKFDVTGYDKITNQSAVAFSSFLGLGYQILPALYAELNFEANHNNRFDEDFRFGFYISYWFRNRSGQPGVPPQQPMGSTRVGEPPVDGPRWWGRS